MNWLSLIKWPTIPRCPQSDQAKTQIWQRFQFLCWEVSTLILKNLRKYLNKTSMNTDRWKLNRYTQVWYQAKKDKPELSSRRSKIRLKISKGKLFKRAKVSTFLNKWINIKFSSLIFSFLLSPWSLAPLTLMNHLKVVWHKKETHHKHSSLKWNWQN